MHYKSFDGTDLACTVIGPEASASTIILLHGLFSDGHTNWVRYGTARRLQDAGHRLILPDFRGHGASATPADQAAWPEDVLARDIDALIAHLRLGNDFILAGFSLGARTVIRMLARGSRPRAAIVAGMGLQGITSVTARSAWFIRMIEGVGQWPRGTPEHVAERFMQAHVADPAGLVHLLRLQQATTSDELRALDLPIAVLAGADDHDNGSAADLAAVLPQASYREIPGNHMSSVTRPELADAMLAFLAEQA